MTRANLALDALRRNITSKIEAGEAQPITAIEATIPADTRVYTGYLSSDGRAITSWDGAQIMIVTRWKDARSGFRTAAGRRAIVRAVWAKTSDGRSWYGKGSGAGMAITMRETSGKVPRARRVSCTSCQLIRINGIVCHETGCPNAPKGGR